jgi:hypothetical protein
MSGRKLTPEDPRWWRLEKALEDRSQQLGGADPLAVHEFNQALKADRLRVMRRRVNCPPERLAASAWEDFYIHPLMRIRMNPPKGGRVLGRMRWEGVAVWSHKLGGRVLGQWFYVWRPDYEKIFLDVAAPATSSTGPRSLSQEVPENRGRKPVHNRADLQSAALGLALQRKKGAPGKTQTDVVNELRDWCQRNKRKVPGDSYLNEVVADAFRIMRTLKS